MLQAWDAILWGTIGLIAYTYAGYPLLMAFLALAFRPQPDATESLPSVTIVIAAYNEAPIIAERIENCLALDYPPERLEILIVMDGCTDGTASVAARFAGPNLRLISHDVRVGKVNALNTAIPQARGEIVVGSDANCFFRPDVLRQLVRHFGDPRVAMVAGAKRIQPGRDSISQGEGLYWRYESYLKRMDSRVSTALGATGEIFAVRRAVFRLLPSDSIIEDFYLSMQLVMEGHRIVYEPAAIAAERASASFADEFKRKARITAGGWQTIFRLWPLLFPQRVWGSKAPLVWFQYVSHRVLRWILVPFCLPMALLANSVLALSGSYRELLSLQVLFYLLAALGYVLQRRGVRSRVLQAPCYFVFLNLAAMVGAYRFWRGRQPVTWEKARRLGAG